MYCSEDFNASDIEIINGKRLVFIVDEAHRSTFGDMLSIIKETFPNAIFFGFTGTPVFEENAKKTMPKQMFLAMNSTVLAFLMVSGIRMCLDLILIKS